MKNFNDLGDFMAMGIGVLGALLKGLKSKFKISTIIISCIVAGILTFSVTGVIEMFYNEVSPKIIILVSFTVGWVTNEITNKMDEFIGDLYTILLAYVKTFFTKK